MSGIELTESQQAAVAAFRSFLEGDGQVFMLKGAAGTGKTTLVAEFLHIVGEQMREFALMAPTGRAAYIIGRKTKKPAATIHRSIYSLESLKSTSQNKDDEDDGGVHLRFGLKANDDSLRAVYFVDEASMISDIFSEQEAFSFGSGRLLADLFTFARGRKIVLVGDYAQLPPVGMNFSPALDKDYIEREFNCHVTEHMLREVMRQDGGSRMLANATKIRKSIENKTYIEFRLDEGDDSQAENIDLLTPYYNLWTDKPGHNAAVIAYSNRQALDYNLAIRRHYYGEDAPRLKAGDLLMICRNNYSHCYELFNGNIVLVEACQPDSEVILRHVRVKMGKNRIESVELRFRRATIRFAVADEAVTLNVMLLDNFLDDVSGSVGGLLARALVVDFNNRLPEEMKKRYAEIQRLLRSRSELTQEQRELRDAYVKLLNDDPFYNAVICKYGYAMTCHKAQGGEWDNVFVDMCRFGGTANEDYFRWAYTALTRASKRIWHYRAPEFDYISGLVVEEIQPSANIRVSNYGGDTNFCEARFARIKAMAEPLGLAASDDRSRPYQHLVTLTDSCGNIAKFQLWYKAHGYNGRDLLVSSTSEEFTALCMPIIEKSFAPDFVPFSSPDRPFAEKLVAFVRSQIDEVGIQLLDITRERYQDVFHLKTDGLARISIFFDKDNRYTYMRLISSLGPLDNKLQALRQRFI